MMPEYLLAFILAVGVALFVTPLVIVFAAKTGAMDEPDSRKVHKKPIPRIGGLGIYISCMVSMITVMAFADLSGELFMGVVGLIISGTLMMIVGLIDDYKNLPAKVKLLGQIIASAVLVIAFDVRIDFITDPFGSSGLQFQQLFFG